VNGTHLPAAGSASECARPSISATDLPVYNTDHVPSAASGGLLAPLVHLTTYKDCNTALRGAGVLPNAMDFVSATAVPSCTLWEALSPSTSEQGAAAALVCPAGSPASARFCP
jgi:hypothetical protein